MELVQACGATASEAHQLVDYVYGRPVGEKAQEVGGVMVTLAALCLAQSLAMHAAGESELTRIWTKVEQIRAKQAAKPKHSPLPAQPAPAQPVGADLLQAAYDLTRYAASPFCWKAVCVDHAVRLGAVRRRGTTQRVYVSGLFPGQERDARS